ncbi:hypothetical protein [Stenotrophomonas maltophilia]|uniref:hypothetical protein n=1 Tax=Stenotrophomonas maltophilia TaxID=40324 RepID=UPI00201CE8A5|nr:hypothetical protein [Stenotrophomonas maltophilia]UQY97354.1 hypothetical protein LZ605_08330 [Stenotrophomonas maltophilia]
MSAPVDVQRLRDALAWHLRLERGASRRARYFERRANNPRNPNRAASARVAAGYQGDAAKDRRRIAELRAELARVKGGAA